MNLSSLFGGGEATPVTSFTSIWEGTGIFSLTTIVNNPNCYLHGIQVVSRYTGGETRGNLRVFDGTIVIFQMYPITDENQNLYMFTAPYKITDSLQAQHSVLTGTPTNFSVRIYYSLI